ncbi:hypothetical protein [Pectobacterium brasiliense]|uniref:hypothetical protein n=1 Tax=Pectobacterium brasiliense TaxID=180957 RepID=UPI001969138C|nr:hypothetical protein [Pectobacterium brasiliense]MBN3161117.1 hypothetical protein [Pectobacterium brasiliense]
MSKLNFIGLSQLLSKNGDQLQQNMLGLIARISTYWGSNRDPNHQISITLNDRELEVSIPQMRFECFSESKLAIHERMLIGEVTFFTLCDGKSKEFHKVFIDQENYMSFTTYGSEPSIDIDYAKNIEHYFMNSLIEAAMRAGLI